MGTGPAGRGVFTVGVTTRRSGVLVWNNEIPYVYLHFGVLRKARTDIYCRIGYFSSGFHWTRVKNGPFFKFDFLDYRMGKQSGILAVADLAGQISSSAPLVDAVMNFQPNYNLKIRALASAAFTLDFRRGHRRKQAAPSRTPSE